MDFSANITKRTRRRRLRSGKVVDQVRHVLSFRDPRSGQRHQEFFVRYKVALARRNELVRLVAEGHYHDKRDTPTITEAIDDWLGDREGKVKASTLANYRVVVSHIVRLLGRRKISDVSTAEIRRFYNELCESSGAYTGRRALSHLQAILSLAAEDYGVRPAPMPSNLGRGSAKLKKHILMPDEVAVLLAEARRDPYGLYYGFPFLTGTRISEQLGLLWSEVDFDGNTIRICRIQERDGSLSETTKTAAGTREIPMAPQLREMLLAWRLRCPRHDAELHRVFPGPGRLQKWPCRARAVVARYFIKISVAGCGRRSSNGSAYHTRRRTQQGTRLPRSCKCKVSRSGSLQNCWGTPMHR